MDPERSSSADKCQCYFWNVLFSILVLVVASLGIWQLSITNVSQGALVWGVFGILAGFIILQGISVWWCMCIRRNDCLCLC